MGAEKKKTYVQASLWVVAALTLAFLFITISENQPAANSSVSSVKPSDRVSGRASDLLASEIGMEQGQSFAATTSSATRSQDLDLPTRELILECVKGSRGFNDFRSPRDFITLDELMAGAMGASGKEAHGEVTLRNVHVKTPRGEMLRLHFSPREAADGEARKLEMKLFGVDRENLPVSRELPEGFASLGVDEAIERFKSQGDVVLDEAVTTQKLRDGAGAIVIMRNDRISELQLFLQARTMVCSGEGAGIHCRCF